MKFIKNKNVWAGFFMALVFARAPTAAQSVKELKTQYASPEIFLIRPGVLMTPDFSNEGNLCGAYLQKNHFPHTGETMLENGIEPEELYQAISRLSPGHADTQTGQTLGYRRTNRLSAELYFEDLQITVWSISRSSPAKTVLPRFDDADALKKKLSIADFLKSFGDVDVARIWWPRRDGCHDR